MLDNKDPAVFSVTEADKALLTNLDPALSPSQRAEALEQHLINKLDHNVIPVKSVIYTSGEYNPTFPRQIFKTPEQEGKEFFVMGNDPRLVKMPDRPTLLDFFELRFAPASHLLQSAQLAVEKGYPEKLVLACLLHDISMVGFMNPDHGYWGAQLVAPYVDEEVTWAIRSHQMLRFYPDDSVGYEYPPDVYKWLIGPDFKPEPYMDQEYKRIRNHKWYMSARLITLNDLYSFDINAKADLSAFTDIIGRHFRQPKEGLGFDGSASAHMWRSINWPTRIM